MNIQNKEYKVLEKITELHKKIQGTKSLKCIPNGHASCIPPGELNTLFDALNAEIALLLGDLSQLSNPSITGHTEYAKIIERYNALIRCIMDVPAQIDNSPRLLQEPPIPPLHQFLILDTVTEKKKFLKQSLFGKTT